MNLLSDAVFDVGGESKLSLPALLAACARDEVRSFPRLRAHQRTAWHMFRVQLAALALRKAEENSIPTDAAAWADLLRALTSDLGDDPWRLVVDDRSVPAFLQPPDPGKLKWEEVHTPDALDILITARNHDVKRAVANEALAEDWILALVSVQTSEGYGGRGQYGIARMNGGSSSRPFLGLVPTESGGTPNISQWWARDVALLLDNQHDETPLTYGGPALLWCLPWPEGQSLPVQSMAPWAIEVCRRIRLNLQNGQLHAARAGSKAKRVESEAFKGALGDPWAPVTGTDASRKSLTLGEGYFDYKRICELTLSGNWEIPAAAQVQKKDDKGTMSLLAEALSRGNSKTDGLKSRLVPMPERSRGLFRTNRQLITDIAATQMQEIEATDKVLREAVALYAAGGEREKVGRDERRRAHEARMRLDAVADSVFFEHLWTRVEAAADDPQIQADATAAFKAVLATTARRELERAFSAIPCQTIRRPVARARAGARLEGGLRRVQIVESNRLESEDAHR